MGKVLWSWLLQWILSYDIKITSKKKKDINKEVKKTTYKKKDNLQEK